MRSSLDAFLLEIGELATFVESIGKVKKTLARHHGVAIRACLNTRRRLDYAAFVITLYSAFETFVEDIAWAYTELESSRNKYSELSVKLRSKHLKQSAELLGRVRLGEGRYKNATVMAVV